MAITVGCFALVDPFTVLAHQLRRISDMGFRAGAPWRKSSKPFVLRQR